MADAARAEPAAKKAKVAEGAGDLGAPMSVDDERYTSSLNWRCGASGLAPECECPGFDERMCPDQRALLGRWVRSPRKFVGWDEYMHYYGMTGDRALQETEEPQEHVLLEFSPKHMRILHRLCWRDGLDCEYTVPIDGSMKPVPAAMVARASSSWKVNTQALWSHAWDKGNGNPLHRGLRTEQKLTIGGVNYALRYWRSLIRPGEMRINVEVTYCDTGKYAVTTQRFFHKIDVDLVYAAAVVASDGPAESAIRQASVWTHCGRAVRLVVLAHASNMDPGWESLDDEARWEMAEPFPSAGRSSGPFLTGVRRAARDAGVWACCGVVVRAPEGKRVLRGVALVGADGWLHGIHTDRSPGEGFAAGSGEWPATQRSRPLGVYDTELGRLAMFPSHPDAETKKAFADMGTELLIVPPAKGSPASRVDVDMASPGVGGAAEHGHRVNYEICGPETLERAPDQWRPTLVCPGATGLLEVRTLEPR